MQEDFETVFAKNAVMRGQLDQAKAVIERYEAKIIEQDELIKGMEKKVTEAQQDANQMRTIMTQNITESNTKINQYVEKIQTLNATIVGLRAELKELNGDND